MNRAIRVLAGLALVFLIFYSLLLFALAHRFETLGGVLFYSPEPVQFVSQTYIYLGVSACVLAAGAAAQRKAWGRVATLGVLLALSAYSVLFQSFLLNLLLPIFTNSNNAAQFFYTSLDYGPIAYVSVVEVAPLALATLAALLSTRGPRAPASNIDPDIEVTPLESRQG